MYEENLKTLLRGNLCFMQYVLPLPSHAHISGPTTAIKVRIDICMTAVLPIEEKITDI